MSFYNTIPKRQSYQLALPVLLTAMLAGALTLSACEPATLVDADVHSETAALALSSNKSAANGANVNQQLAAARAGTAAFHDIETAMAAGFELLTPCVDHPTEGGMGYHYINFANTALDPAKPQILLYEPQKNGRMRLVGLEYVVPFEVVPADGTPPELFGEEFDHGPPGWILHVWTWRHNPSGMFADFNPNVSCQFAD